MGKVLETIKSRRSIRHFSSDPVPTALVDKVIEAGLYAPSALGRQECIVVAVSDRETRDRISALNASVMGRSGSDPFYGAPVILMVLGPKDYPPYVCDGSLMLGNMMLEAHELGLGSCWIHRAKEESESPEGQELLHRYGVPDGYVGIGHLALGYIDGGYPSTPERKPDRVIKIQ